MTLKKRQHLFVGSVLAALLFFVTVAFIQSGKATTHLPLKVTEGGTTCTVYDEPKSSGIIWAGNAVCTNVNGSTGCFMVCGKTNDVKITCASGYEPYDTGPLNDTSLGDGWACAIAGTAGTKSGTAYTYGTVAPSPSITPPPSPTPSPSPSPSPAPAPTPAPSPAPATPTDKTAPAISEISIVSADQTSATITWTTDEASSSQINYGTSFYYGYYTKLDSTLTTSHKVVITGLKSGTTYNFSVRSKDSTGNLGKGANQAFKTLAATTTLPVTTTKTLTDTLSKKTTAPTETPSPSPSTEKITEKTAVPEEKKTVKEKIDTAPEKKAAEEKKIQPVEKITEKGKPAEEKPKEQVTDKVTEKVVEKITDKIEEKTPEPVEEALKEVVCSDITEKTKNGAEMKELLKLMHETGTYLPPKNQLCKPKVKTKWTVAISMALALADENCGLDVTTMASTSANVNKLRNACMAKAQNLGLVEKKRTGNITKGEFYELIMKGANLAAPEKLPNISYKDIDADSPYYDNIAQAKYYGIVKTYKKKGEQGYILPKTPLTQGDALHIGWKALQKSPILHGK